LALAIAALLATACGGSAISLASGEDSKTPAQVIKDAQAALRQSKGVTVHFTGTSGTTKVDLTMSGDGKGNVTGAGTFDSTAIEFLVYGGTFYIKGGDFFAKSAGTSVTEAQKQQLLALINGKWVVMGKADSSAGFGDMSKLATPGVLADCLDDHGTVDPKLGTDTVQGQKVVVINEKGDSPGDAAAKLEVRVASPNYPVRLVQSGAVAPGTPKAHGKCPTGSGGPDSSTTQDVTIDFSGFDSTSTIAAPTNTVDLSKLAGG
jgi:hypothetical protein